MLDRGIGAKGLADQNSIGSSDNTRFTGKANLDKVPE